MPGQFVALCRPPPVRYLVHTSHTRTHTHMHGLCSSRRVVVHLFRGLESSSKDPMMLWSGYGYEHGSRYWQVRPLEVLGTVNSMNTQRQPGVQNPSTYGEPF